MADEGSASGRSGAEGRAAVRPGREGAGAAGISGRPDRSLLGHLPGDAWVGPAGKIIESLGFELLTGEHLATPAESDLLVAIRDRPTLHHFDPEEVTYWTTEGGRGRAARIDRSIKSLPLEGRFAWGRIAIADRLGMANQFLSFGGILRVAALDPGTLVILFSSPAPIQRWAGHSQGTDPLTEPIGAFFARMMIPIDFVPGAEGRIASADPFVLYCAFVCDLDRRLARSAELRSAYSGFASWTPQEAHRLQGRDAAAWRAAQELHADLELDKR